MLKWFRRKIEEEQPAYCGFILMQSEWYKKQLEDGVIDHTDTLTMVFQEETVAELEAQGHTNVQYVDFAIERESMISWVRVRDWFRWV